MNVNKVLIVIINLTVVLIVHGSTTDQQQPPGYFAFEKATRTHGVPPRVLKPPYLPANVPCPGAIKSDYRLSPKDTLCGDLNKGYVPLNPMLQTITGQPYPFELIKNKTLHFLARSLPFLKQDINNIPKVAKIPTDTKLGINNDFVPSNVDKGMNNGNYDYSGNHVIKKRSLANFTNLRWDLLREAKLGGHGFNYTEARQKVCEQNDGMLCQVMSALGGGSQVSSGLLNTLSSAAQVMTAASNAANTAQSLSSLASLIQQFSGSGSTSGSSSSTSGSSTPSSASLTSLGSSGSSGSSGTSEVSKSMFTQVLSLLASLNANSGSTSSLSTTTNNFSPLSAIVDYLMNVNPTAISSLLPARRKKPLDFEDIAAEAMTVSQVPPTPCPSIEEYVAPVYARNYQGVWKYVVQIPHEGYFTQTVQKTSCVKGRCDFMEGVCHESPRWVSLLVAEIFYPQPKFNNLIASPSEVKSYTVNPNMQVMNKPKHQKTANHHVNMAHLNQMKHSLHGYTMNPMSHHLTGNGQPMSYPEIDQYLNRKIGYREEPFVTDEHGRLAKPRMMRMYNDEEKAQIVSSSHSASAPAASPPSPPSSSSSTSTTSSNRKTETVKDEECDGHDAVGCYQMRVYYDWFLIPGSCKCWKKTASQGSSLDTLKKLFIGK
uniref:Spaetzle domain-containing protein n=1 Tax=Tetranychus urticae TaxID=32264 RepID=T1KGC5_TETUR